jgi:hypothetical protein
MDKANAHLEDLNKKCSSNSALIAVDEVEFEFLHAYTEDMESSITPSDDRITVGDKISYQVRLKLIQFQIV